MHHPSRPATLASSTRLFLVLHPPSLRHCHLQLRTQFKRLHSFGRLSPRRRLRGVLRRPLLAPLRQNQSYSPPRPPWHHRSQGSSSSSYCSSHSNNSAAASRRQQQQQSPRAPPDASRLSTGILEESRFLPQLLPLLLQTSVLPLYPYYYCHVRVEVCIAP